MSTVFLQLSLYPLRQPHVGPAIAGALEAFRSRGLDVRPDTMSTVVIGETGAVFDGLKAAFLRVAALGDTVMVASISNCCQAPAGDPRDS
jgi:uncharacterized protein YqgV (UPF0045/DUF77 family)